MNLATMVLAWEGSPVGFATAAVTLALGAGFALQGARAVQRIADSHRRILYPGDPGRAAHQAPPAQ
jgi:hypothetical protein